MTVITEARKNPKVDALFRAVDAQTPITVIVVPGLDWSTVTTGGATVIEVGEAKHPDAALYHELLHAEFKLAGYRQYSQLVPINDRAQSLVGLLSPLDNELQHHRIFARFVAAGFADAAFYNDGDKSSLRKTREELRKMKSSDPVEHFLLKLLTVIAPGGKDSVKERAQLRTFLMLRAGPKKAARLAAIEAHFAAWAAASTFDVGPTLQAIFQAVGDCDGAWVGASTNFPDDGYFTGAPFDMAAAEHYARTNVRR